MVPVYHRSICPERRLPARIGQCLSERITAGFGSILSEKLTIRQIAKLAGTSRSSVSRVLNNHPNVSLEMRDIYHMNPHPVTPFPDGWFGVGQSQRRLNGFRKPQALSTDLLVQLYSLPLRLQHLRSVGW